MNRTVSAFAKTPNSEPRVDLGRVLDLERRSGGRACRCRTSRSPRRSVMRGNGRAGGSRPIASNASTTTCSMHVEHVLALDERHLDVELPELELPVGAEILVPEAAWRSGSSGRSPPITQQLLEELRRLRQREELPGLQARRDDEVARALGRAAGHGSASRCRRSPRPSIVRADRLDDRVREAQVALHAASRRRSSQR